MACAIRWLARKEAHEFDRACEAEIRHRLRESGLQELIPPSTESAAKSYDGAAICPLGP
jgi:hypothetical protein